MSLNLESKDGVIFETDAPVMFSPMEKKLGLTFQWKAWKSRVVSINRADKYCTETIKMIHPYKEHSF